MLSPTLIQHVVVLVSSAIIFRSTFAANGKTRVENNLYSWFEGIEKWEPTEELKRDLPAYQAGWDYEGRPVFVSEFGKWDVRKYTDSDKPEVKDLIYKRTEKVWYDWIVPNPQSNSSEEGAVIIIDAKGLSAYQLASTNAVTLQLTTMRLGETFEAYFNEVFIVNANFIAQSWVNLIRPVAGKLIGRAVVVSSNLQTIGATLRQKIPKEQLPPWLGGNEGFKPVRIF